MEISNDFNEGENFNEILKDVNFKYPCNAFNLFIKSQINGQINFADFKEPWNNLEENEKQKYYDSYKENKRKYLLDLELIRHYLFKDYNYKSKKKATAYRIFLYEKTREALINKEDLKQAKSKASVKWAKMTKNERQFYIDKRKKNDEWFAKAENIKNISPITLFVEKRFKEEDGKNIKLSEIMKDWKELSEIEKLIYINDANKLNKEKENLKNIFDLIHGVKPKYPITASKLYCQEKIKNNEIVNIEEGLKKWKYLDKNEKDKYLKKEHINILAYKFKNMVYKKRIKRILPKKPKNAKELFYEDMKIKGENDIKWQELSEHEKKKYKINARALKREYKNNLKEYEGKVYNMPKKPSNAFHLFISDRLPILFKEKPRIKFSEHIKQIAKEWKFEIDKNIYLKKAEKSLNNYKEQLKHFIEYGFYLINNEEDIKEGEEKEEKIEKDN